MNRQKLQTAVEAGLSLKHIYDTWDPPPPLHYSSFAAAIKRWLYPQEKAARAGAVQPQTTAQAVIQTPTLATVPEAQAKAPALKPPPLTRPVEPPVVREFDPDKINLDKYRKKDPE